MNSSSRYKKDRFIWIDLEMTGLNPDTDRIIEIATVITDHDLNTIAEGPLIAIHQSEQVMQGMDDWNLKHHSQSGLIQRVKTSQISEEQAQEQVLTFFMQHVDAKVSPMCGNSICQDRRFLYRYMPKLENYFHYRNLDVSTLKILAQCWAPRVYGALSKQAQHMALQDVYDSIAELRHYKECFLKV